MLSFSYSGFVSVAIYHVNSSFKALSEKCCLHYLSEVAFVLSNFVSFLCGSFQGSFPALSCAVCILCSTTKFLFVLRTTV